MRAATDMAIRLRRGLELVPNDTMLRRYWRETWSEQGKFEESLALWAGLITFQPQRPPESLVGRVQTLITCGKPEQAMQTPKPCWALHRKTRCISTTRNWAKGKCSAIIASTHAPPVR